MTDELRPDIKEELKRLPRERMPEGLEARVTGAMRDYGLFERRRRVVAVTSGRVAGLVAACVALVIAAYSIGLHQGDTDLVLPSAPPPERLDRAAADVGEKELSFAPEPESRSEPAPAPPKKERAESDEPARAVADPEERRRRYRVPSGDTDDATAALMQKSPAMEAGPAPGSTRATYMLFGVPVVVDAPDSVRVVEDERGQMLLIYSSDGIIRIRPAGDR